MGVEPEGRTVDSFHAPLPSSRFLSQINERNAYLKRKKSHDVRSVNSVRQYCKSISSPTWEAFTDSLLSSCPDGCHSHTFSDGVRSHLIKLLFAVTYLNSLEGVDFDIMKGRVTSLP